MLFAALLFADIYGDPSAFLTSSYDTENNFITVNSYFYDDTSEGPLGVPENGSVIVYEIFYGGSSTEEEQLTDFDIFTPDTASADILLSFFDDPMGDLIYEDYQAPEAAYNLEQTNLLSWDWEPGKGLQGGQTSVLVVFSEDSMAAYSSAAFFTQSQDGAIGAGVLEVLVPSMVPSPSGLALMSLTLLSTGRRRKS